MKIYKNKALFFLVVALIFFVIVPASSSDAVLNPEEVSKYFSSRDRFHPVVAKNGMIATQERLASEIGLSILKRGGNAIDAAVAVGFVLAVTLPRAGNIGGGGFMIVHIASENKTLALDYREKAPLAAERDMFLDEKGKADSNKSRWSLLSSGVPGTVAGLVEALEKYGTFTLEDVIEPAIKLAREGYPVSYDLAVSLNGVKKRLASIPSTKSIFYKEDGSNYAVGDIFVQSELADTLETISKDGKDGFYKGKIAKQIAEYVQANGGIITEKDLQQYSPRWREPVVGSYRGYTIASMSPPSSGGVHLVQILNILEPFSLKELGHNTEQTIQLISETTKLAYADRSRYLGDPDFEDVPIQGLTSKRYADELRKKISLKNVRASTDIQPGNPLPYESEETTHYSIIDKWGNAVSNTYTLNFSYGNGHVVKGTGILLNNEMDDFSAAPGVPNAYGLIGGEFNEVEPQKRMLSSMSPTIVLKNGEVFMATGTPGGSRIITTVLQIILNVIDHEMNIAEATNAVRTHHQWFPDEIRVEEGLNSDVIRSLEQKGYKIVTKSAMGSVQSVVKRDGLLFGASDPRRSGAATVGF